MAPIAEKGPRGEKAVWPAGTGHAGRHVLPGSESLSAASWLRVLSTHVAELVRTAE